jgi:hypothetical protein
MYAFGATAWVGLTLLAQWAFLRPREGWTIRLTSEGRPLKSAVVVASFMAMLLTVGLFALALELPDWWEPGILGDSGGMVGIWIVMLFLWVAWAWVFFVHWRQGDRYTQLGKMIRGLVVGSLLEGFVAVPAHVWATRQRECYCARGTYTTLIFAGTVLLWAFGPGIVLLYVHERHRRARLLPSCTKCCYSLRGLPLSSQRCPECGTPFDERVKGILAAAEEAGDP